MNDFLEQFVLESRELVEQGTRDLLALEGDPNNKQLLDGAFRAFHTLKGGAGIVDFDAMAHMIHAAEDLLSGVRAGTDRLNAQLVGDCLSCLDQVVQWLEVIEERGDLPPKADASAAAMIERLAKNRIANQGTQQAAVPAAPAKVATTISAAILEAQLALLTERGVEGAQGRVGSAARVAANVLRNSGAEQNLIGRVERAAEAFNDPAQLTDAIRAAMDGAGPAAAAGTDASLRTLRVDAERVNELVNLAGELTIVMNAFDHLARRAQESGAALASALRDRHTEFSRLVSALQTSVLNLRVLPLRQVFQRFPRLVREISLAQGKQIRLLTSGEDTEADKAIVETLYEPLLHILRNAIDHGLEPPAERAAAGKAAVGTLSMRARRQGDQVVIEIEDDGHGIDLARVREVALQRGLASSDVLDAYGEADTMALIFLPGFSTAREVSGISGRGVGMDAVRTAIERLGGRVTIESRAGHGSIVRLNLPFSVMMTRVLTVKAGGQTFGLPIDTVVETLRIPRSQIFGVGAAQAFVRRNRTIPLIHLAQALDRDAAMRLEPEATMVVVSFAGHHGALEVDRLGDHADIMLKPMAGLLSDTPGIAGTSLLGDGSVLIVLDVEDLLS